MIKIVKEEQMKAEVALYVTQQQTVSQSAVIAEVQKTQKIANGHIPLTCIFEEPFEGLLKNFKRAFEGLQKGFLRL